MAMSKQDVLRWLETLPEYAEVAIDDDGFTLVELTPSGQLGKAYLEVGGLPEDWDEKAWRTRENSTDTTDPESIQ